MGPDGAEEGKGGRRGVTAAARYVVHGRVQGVGFRWFVWREAERLELCGYVRNLRDGSVEVIAQGSPEALDNLAAQLARGPAMAHVSHVEKSDAAGELVIPNGFDIR